MSDRIESVIATLEDLLEEERALLTAGRIAQLEGLAERKLDLLRRIGTEDVSGPVAARLRQGLTRNAGLLGAAAEGLRDVQSRLRQIIEGPTLTTYGPAGQRQSIAAAAPSVIRSI